MHKKILSILFASLLVGLVLADDSKEVYPFEDAVQEERFLSLLNELRCPKCQGSNLSGSNAPIAIDYKQNENKTLEIIKSWGYGIIGIVVILSIFTGFKYPWKWIDALYETEKEKLEIIANNWSNAYTPLIRWCAANTAESESMKAVGKEKLAY